METKQEQDGNDKLALQVYAELWYIYIAIIVIIQFHFLIGWYFYLQVK